MSENAITSLDQVEALPGFQIIEFTPGYTVLKLPSEFTVKISRMPPFLFDMLQTEDLKDPGQFKIKVRLLANLKPDEKIEQEILWHPPRDDDDKIIVPEWDEESKAWAYYKQWELHERRRAEVFQELAQRKWNFILLKCVEVMDGPYDIADNDWLEPMLYVVKEPESFGERKILFLKSQVIAPQQAMHVISFFVNVQEVTMEGLKKAFDSFRRTLRWESNLSALGAIAQG